MASPTTTFSAEGTLHNATLAASASVNIDIDLSARIGAHIHIKNTPAGISGTRGVRMRVYTIYGTTPSVSPTPIYDYPQPSLASGVAEADTLFLTTGKWRLTLTNLDATYGCAIEVTPVYITGMA